MEEPGLFFKGTDGTLFKVGPVAITNGGSAPNSAAAGPSGNLIGETWLDGRTSFTNPVLKIYNGAQWVAANGFQVDNSSGNFQLSKALTVSTLIVNGSGPNSYVRLPNGPSSDESSITPSAGMIRFDTTLNQFKGFNGTTWGDLSSGNLTDLLVTGNAQINGTLTVDGDVTLGDGTSGDELQVNATATFAGDVSVGGGSSDLFVVNASSSFTAPLRLINQQPLRFYHGTDSGSNYVAFKAPSSVATSVTWTLPDSYGTAGQALHTDGAGNLVWSTSSGPIQEFTQTIASDYTISAGNNALSVGPVEVAAGVTLTVPADSRYVVA